MKSMHISMWTSALAHFATDEISAVDRVKAEAVYAFATNQTVLRSYVLDENCLFWRKKPGWIKLNKKNLTLLNPSSRTYVSNISSLEVPRGKVKFPAKKRALPRLRIAEKKSSLIWRLLSFSPWLYFKSFFPSISPNGKIVQLWRARVPSVILFPRPYSKQ